LKNINEDVRMTKEVLISIIGMQFDLSDEGNDIQVVTSGEYYSRGNSQFLLYEEADEDSGGITKSMIKFRSDLVELTKKGYVNVHMMFEEGKKNLTNYTTVFGDILIGIDTKKIAVEETEDKIVVGVEYALDANYEFLADCKIRIEVAPKETAGNNIFPL